MYLDTGTLIGLTIALASACFVIVISIREHGKLLKKINYLQLALRDEKEKVNGLPINAKNHSQ